jgi:hypothetical protein
MRPLSAAPSDVEDQADDQVDDQIDENGDDAADDQVDDGDTAGDEADDGDDAGQSAAELKAAEQRRKIEARAAERREETNRIARETAAATAQETARVNQDALRRAEADREEREALANMTDDQRVTYQLAKQVKDTQNGMAQIQHMTKSAADQAKFDRLLTRKPQFEKYADEVDRRHQNTLSQGAFVPREAILAHLIGEQTLKSDKVSGQKDAAKRRVQQARGNTGRAARGDTTGRATTGKSVVQKAEEADWAI